MVPAHVLKCFPRLKFPSLVEKFGFEVAAVPKVFYSSHSAPKTNQDDLPSTVVAVKSERVKKISKAMRAYLERAREHNEFMQKETAEYEIGKRHLANIMGRDPEEFSQQDVDKAIEYLLPSGLFQVKARPMMKPPHEIFPKKKEAQFDIEGRPNHFLFYTKNPNYFQALHEIAISLEVLNKHEDELLQKGPRIAEEEGSQANLQGSQWLAKEALETKFMEKISDDEYNYFITCISRLTSNPYSKLVETFIMNFRRALSQQTLVMNIKPLQYDEHGRPFMTAAAQRKKSKAEVTVWGNGSGKVSINNEDLNYFKYTQQKEQIMFPLQFTNMMDEVDIEAKVTSIMTAAPASEAGAIRFAMSLALSSFLTKEEVERMRLAGLLTLDPRTQERKKPGQKGARAKFTWKKR